jgi:hypothetical protein
VFGGQIAAEPFRSHLEFGSSVTMGWTLAASGEPDLQDGLTQES